ncbi:MAG: hypothetical protein COC19_08525 [SAR86 cluster bacterium]|uniref:Ferrous iron transporter FeoA-like domain-containing protein n=1 Tax=SAR86 cluster bacterium TaxID=2030880 RepID=A0A2A4MER8_9GAMM|nr:MAG: hypothetical protein COC19_08525 [SAR86 cluster bacterium]
MSNSTLAQALPGEKHIVLNIAPEQAALKSRLYALGLIPGSQVEVLRFAPLGDPMQIKVGGCFISIRKAEAEIISLEQQES